MATYVYCPDHPKANQNGCVEKSLAREYNYWKQMVEGRLDKQMMNGNEPVTLNYITDGMDYTRHMCNNRYYDSKSRFRQVTKEHGCIEVGNEEATMLKPRKPTKLDKRQRVEDIKRAIYDVKNGRGFNREAALKEASKPGYKLE
jgi:hypothetical protein